MTYANLANSILGNTSRDSRDTRTSSRRDGRGQSQYEQEREGVDAIDREGLSIEVIDVGNLRTVVEIFRNILLQVVYEISIAL